MNPANSEMITQAPNAVSTHDRVGLYFGYAKINISQTAAVISMTERANKALPTINGKSVWLVTMSGMNKIASAPALTVYSSARSESDSWVVGLPEVKLQRRVAK
ncbi:MAG: hypothetical protein QGG34_09640 [SAR202 cluster bacterium]|nr:hypothetical protein [SAR202 cluster bacterium]MDP6300927.1 hypothetical protein [SAR202 cluster bacterium]MDP7103246.1 hypothetical protein [SAR202 cluster bacterium]MDP7224839.1 hypothetical protein [SAR202 cluster bacterium]MDP7412690.1 hypothetical protein [SAR202 cluster bacterium]